MSLKSISRGLATFACLSVLPLYAQTTTTTGTATTTTHEHMTMHKAEHKATTEAKETKTVVKAEKKAVKTTARHTRAMTMTGSRLFNDSTRLATVLVDAQTKVNVSDAVWRTIANEANTLANRVYASAKSSTTRKAAASARTHVREMHAAAMKGDGAGARTHASEALPFVYQIIDASAPAGMKQSHM